MQFGFGVLRLSSQSFWGLTPRELASAFEALSGRRSGAPLGRETMEALMRAFPDQGGSHG
jgi:uncharacterized phage protein (TIGR02216 family)